MSFNNLLLALALTVLWPLGLMGVLAAADWLERRTLATAEAAPRRLRPAATAPAATAAEARQEDADVATAAWPAAVRSVPGGAQGPIPPDDRDGADGERLLARRGGGRHLRRADGGRGGGRHERRR